MTPEERAAGLGDAIETDGEETHVEVWRSDIAAAIREAVIEEHNRVVLLMRQQIDDAVVAEREACAQIADEDAEGYSGRNQDKQDAVERIADEIRLRR
jgi:hypothetical protein